MAKATPQAKSERSQRLHSALHSLSERGLILICSHKNDIHSLAITSDGQLAIGAKPPKT
jgi:hypothetical protein